MKKQFLTRCLLLATMTPLVHAADEVRTPPETPVAASDASASKLDLGKAFARECMTGSPLPDALRAALVARGAKKVPVQEAPGGKHARRETYEIASEQGAYRVMLDDTMWCAVAADVEMVDVAQTRTSLDELAQQWHGEAQAPGPHPDDIAVLGEYRMRIDEALSIRFRGFMSAKPRPGSHDPVVVMRETLRNRPPGM